MIGASIRAGLDDWPPWQPTNRARSRLARFETSRNGELRTCGVVLSRPDRRATDLGDLDLGELAIAAIGRPGATASGKLVVRGYDGAAVFQTRPEGRVELALCGNGTSTLALISSHMACNFELAGPDKTKLQVSLRRYGSRVSQRWLVPGFRFSEAEWLRRPIVHCEGLNRYAVIVGPLPGAVAPEDARCALAGAGLAAKIVVLTVRPNAVPEALFINDKGRHGAAPMTGLATLAILARLSPLVRHVIPLGVIAYRAGESVVEAKLPQIEFGPEGTIEIAMPDTEVRLLPFKPGTL